MTVALEMESAVHLFPLAKDDLKNFLPGMVQDTGPETSPPASLLFLAGSSLVLQKHRLFDPNLFNLFIIVQDLKRHYHEITLI